MTPPDGYTHFQDLRDEAIGRHAGRQTAARMAANEWYEQRVALSRGAEFRTDAPTPDSAYEGCSHEQLYRMVTEGCPVIRSARCPTPGRSWRTR